MKVKPFVLIILDGWGYREAKEHNAIAAAHKPHWDKLWEKYPHTLIEGSGPCVGLPEGQMGNSEVGHLNMGAGRVVYQELTRIDKAIETKEFFENKVFMNAFKKAKNKKIHILGLLSPGGVHSHENQIQAMIQLAAQHNPNNVYVHAFLDGRDTPPQSALASLEKLNQLPCKVASLMGRYYAMDRDKRWDRTEKAYDLLTQAKADFQATSAVEALEKAYARGETDEFVKPTSIHHVTIDDGDLVIFMNFRADRARQLTRAFTEKEFSGFVRQKTPALVEFVSLTQYADDIDAAVAYPPQTLKNTLGEYIAAQHLQQLRIAETEKYAHVTFFFNGGVEEPNAHEERLLIPSPKVATYDLAPDMSAVELTEALVSAIQSQHYSLIICNYANPDMLGHTGNFKATVRAIETIDDCLGKVVSALNDVNGEALITADHGNAELMFDEKTSQPHTAHTSELVPLVYIGRKAKFVRNDGALSDLAPTLLYLMNLSKPKEMTGNNLLELI